MLKPILLLICIACLALSSCNGKVVQGHIKSPDNWVFINKFCYANDDPEFGLFGYTVTVKPTYQNFQLLLYFDSDNSSTQWDAVYRKDLSCIDKEALRAASEHITPPAGSGLMEIHTEYRPHWRYGFVDKRPKKTHFVALRNFPSTAHNCLRVSSALSDTLSQPIALLQLDLNSTILLILHKPMEASSLLTRQVRERKMFFPVSIGCKTDFC
jgi:hypothetical protein